jgi:mannose-6-phosphate isomerase-like protein (cupin superfamily)
MMARVFREADARQLGLPGRKSLEILSGQMGARGVTLRLVEIPVPQPGEIPRGPHFHTDCEECIFVLSGTGITYSESGEYPLAPRDTILLAAGEKHVTRNTGHDPLVLLCFFPSADIAKSTHESPAAGPTPSGFPGNR